MNRIDEKFQTLEKTGEAALIPFVTAGDPNLTATLKILRALAAAGADCIELGIPFSDPTADGPTIQRSSERALKNGVTLPEIFQLIRQFRRDWQVPVILFGYFNPFFCYGLEKFCRDAAQSGADGVLCVDLPPEESAELRRWTDAVGLHLIFLLSPTSGPDRIRLVAEKGRGFVYYVAVTGVTGARQSLDPALRERVARVRRATALPVGVGFGISTPDHAASIGQFADAVVVGSALVSTIERTSGNDNKAKTAGAFIASLKRAMRKPNSRLKHQNSSS